MAKRDPIEEALERLSAVKAAPMDALLISEVRAFLLHRSNLLIAKAAKLAGRRRLADVRADLVGAFLRLMADAPRLDKRCAALTEIATAVYDLDYLEADVYRQGLRHVQMEPSFGEPVDAAAQLRGICAMGIARSRDPEAIAAVVELLVDPEPPARIGAVRALATNGGDTGLVALHLKVLTGDRVPEVLAECFSGLLGDPTESAVAFVARYIDSDDPEVAEAAILALGAARSAKAVETLKEKWERTPSGPIKKVLLLALAASRNENALQFLVGLIESASVETAAELVNALAEQRPSDSIRGEIRTAVERRADIRLASVYARTFPAPFS